VNARPRLVTPTFVLVTVATFAYFLSVGIVIPTLPLFVTGPLAGGSLEVGIAVGAFSVAALLLRPWAGRLGDRRGRRLLLVGGAGFVVLASAGYLVVSALPLLIALRLVAGAGEAFFFVGAASVVNDLAPDERRGEAVSLFSLALYGALAIGPVIGEAVLRVDRFDAVWIASGASAFAAGLLATRVRETRTIVRPDARTPRLIHPRAVRPGIIMASNVWGFAGFNAFVSLYARELGMAGAGLVFLELAAIVFAIRGFGARIPDRLGFVRCARYALIGSMIGLGLIGLWHAPFGLYLGTAFFAVGQALAFPALMSLAVGDAPAEERGAVVGSFTAFVDLAFGLGALTLGAVAALFDYDGTFLVGAVVAMVGIGLLAGLRPGAAAVTTLPALNEVEDPAP
jgi:MFS family permease